MQKGSPQPHQTHPNGHQDGPPDTFFTVRSQVLQADPKKETINNPINTIQRHGPNAAHLTRWELLVEWPEQADRFINVDLAPSLTAAVGPLQKVGSSCTMTGMPPSCKDALIATNKAMLATEDVLDQGHIPACIARQVQQFKYDWQGMEQGVSQAISGFVNGNNIDLYRQGMVKFAEIAQYVQPDMDRITAAEKTCPKTIP